MSRIGSTPPYAPNFRTPELPYGNLIPGVTHSDSVRPHTDVAAAAWLPLGDTATNRAAGFFVRTDSPRTNDYIVITPGKVVALTREFLAMQDSLESGPAGRMVPAGVRRTWAALAAGDPALEYTAVDVAQRVENLATGQPVTAPVVYTKAQLEAALQNRGILRDSEALEDLISYPVGVTPEAVFAWVGGDGLNPTGYRFHNYKRQHKNVILCDYALIYPHVPGASLGSEAVPAISTTASGLGDFEGGSAAWITSDGAELSTFVAARYGALPGPFVALILGTPRIENLFHRPIRITTAAGVDKTASVLVNKVSTPADLTADGDYFVDTELGIIFFFQEDGDAIPAGLAATDLVVFPYHSAHVSYVSDLPCVVGDVRPGDLLVCDEMSNLRKALPATVTMGVADTVDVVVDIENLEESNYMVGQALTFSRYPRESMAMVKTWYENLPTGLVDRVPGSATRGLNDNQTLAGGGQFMIVVNLLK